MAHGRTMACDAMPPYKRAGGEGSESRVREYPSLITSDVNFVTLLGSYGHSKAKGLYQIHRSFFTHEFCNYLLNSICPEKS